MCNPGTILLLAVLSAFCGLAFHVMMYPGMIFNKYGRILSKLANKNDFLREITKPLGGCIICNTTWIGFIIGTLQQLNAKFTLWSIPIILFTGLAAAGIVILLINLYELLQRH